MRIKRMLAVLGGLTLATVVVLPPGLAAGQGEPAGLWGKDFSAQQNASDCGRWQLDGNGFCFADDVRNGLELGMKFRTDRPVEITGIRIYRVDTAAVEGSLWSAGGTLLARGKFSSSSAHGWQDMSFTDPVSIVPGKTYVASYFTPNTRYAFEYNYFANSALTVGPITALRADDGNPQGVHCYDDQQCDFFPVHGFRSSTYWVTPLWRDSATAPGPGPGPAPGPAVDRVAPRVSVVTPSRGAVHVKVVVKVKTAFSEPVRRRSLTASSVRLVRKGSTKAVRATMTYDAAHRRVVLHPRKALRHRTTYRVVITTYVLDTYGNRFDQDRKKPGLQKMTWTFRTR
jgi:Domain of unknown function (DUF4082)/Bacterial Ig-like domain